MKNIVIISGHPDLKVSCANKTILDEIAAKCPQADIRKLAELYPDYNFDVKAEQAALEKADIIVFQYPTHWYGVPGIMKLYIDKVMEHGWAYGSKGTALKGKAFVISTTTGVPESGYTKEGIVGRTIEEFSYGLFAFAAMCKLDCKKLFHLGGAMYIPGVTPDDKAKELVERCKKQAGDILECLGSL